MRRLTHLLFGPGIAVIVFGIGVAHSVLRDPNYRFGSQNSLIAYALLALLHVLIAHITGLPDEVRDVQPAFAASVAASGLATGLWLALQTISPGLLPRWVILVAAAAVPPWTFVVAWTTVIARRRQASRERVVAMVSASDAETLHHDVASEFPLREREFLMDDLVAIEVVNNRFSTEGRMEQVSLDDREFGANVTVVVVSEAAAQRDDVYRIASKLHASGARVRTLSDFYAEHFGKLPVSELSRMALLFDVRDLHHPAYRHVKRFLDICGGVLAGFACVVVSPFIVLGNLVANRGTLLYRQRRVGRDSEVFTILKFRTMTDVTDGRVTENASPWTALDDPRVTPFGRLLRRTHLDELPQAVNILRGELSLVGPRPEQPHYVESLVATEPAFQLRHMVTPGLTGWAQVKHRYAATEAAAMEKLQFDLYYVRYQSLSLDLRILSRTVRSVLRHRGR